MVRAAIDVLRPLASEPLRGEPLRDEPRRDPPRATALPDRVGAPAQAAADELTLLYRRHHPLVYRLALRYGRGDVAWAEDITQDVFLGLFQVLPTLDDRDDLDGWLYRATTNRCLNRLRRDRFLDLAPVRWLLGQTHGEPRPPEALTIARDDLRRAFAVLDTLPPKERVAFAMYHLDEKDQDEIGRVLGHSKGYVCKLIQRAQARLRAAGWEVP